MYYVKQIEDGDVDENDITLVDEEVIEREKEMRALSNSREGFIYWIRHSVMKKKELTNLPSIRFVKPNLIVCNGTRAFDEKRGEYIYINAKFFVKAASSYKKCAKIMLQYVKAASIQVNASTYSYDSAHLTANEYHYYVNIHSLSIADFIDEMMARRITIDCEEPWEALQCPDRSQFQHDHSFKELMEKETALGHKLGTTLLQKKGHGAKDAIELVTRPGNNYYFKLFLSSNFFCVIWT